MPNAFVAWKPARDPSYFAHECQLMHSVLSASGPDGEWVEQFALEQFPRHFLAVVSQHDERPAEAMDAAQARVQALEEQLAMSKAAHMLLRRVHHPASRRKVKSYTLFLHPEDGSPLDNITWQHRRQVEQLPLVKDPTSRREFELPHFLYYPPGHVTLTSFDGNVSVDTITSLYKPKALDASLTVGTDFSSAFQGFVLKNVPAFEAAIETYCRTCGVQFRNKNSLHMSLAYNFEPGAGMGEIMLDYARTAEAHRVAAVTAALPQRWVVKLWCVWYGTEIYNSEKWTCVKSWPA